MGRGRHALVLAELGFRVFGVDVRLDAVRDAVALAARRGLVVRGWCADLTEFPLARERFELIVVSRYLQRDLFPSLSDTLASGGVVLFETFTEAQRGHGRMTAAQAPWVNDAERSPRELLGWMGDDKCTLPPASRRFRSCEISHTQ
jgi:SAM-dependent methyltransferase